MRLRARGTSLFALLGPVALVLTGCGSDEPALPEGMAESMAELGDLMESAEAPDPAEESWEPEIVPLEILLPEEGDTPAGWTRLPASCESPDGEGWFSYAVPADWERGSVGTGSGGPLGHSLDIGWRSEAGTVDVELDPEPRGPDGSFTDSAYDGTGSFDYDYTVMGDTTTTTRITFDPVTTVDVGGQDIELLVAEADQAPDLLSSTVYKARIEVAEVPNPAPGDDDKVFPRSYLIEIRHDPAETQLTPKTVADIVGSLAMPACSVEMLVVETEMGLGADVDEDGEVSTVADYKELLGQ